MQAGEDDWMQLQRSVLEGFMWIEGQAVSRIITVPLLTAQHCR